ncbi:hypothetical protein [Gracilimonas mengyeensis]|uniref:hypothetical protein n=1 Tax=Gracilimonas mengyeensis TaxID=1302730 RepID=UPI00163DC098|nr:hypothetical protein [Gracilimonas mengyeensis]
MNVCRGLGKYLAYWGLVAKASFTAINLFTFRGEACSSYLRNPGLRLFAPRKRVP